ncbi:MAG: hypothetical protein EOO40_00750 [Deltaproteobacteria bacterium]|nr:MAG: hypothetical protein EOO40_00750 [Deltaproteobacteria bacterium]
MRGSKLGLILLLLMLWAPMRVLAQSPGPGAPPGFGEAHQWFVRATSTLNGGSQVVRHRNGPTQNYFLFGFEPAVGFFAARDFFVQLALGIGRSSTTSSSNVLLPTASRTLLSVAPAVGYNFRLSRLLSVFPDLALRFSEVWQTEYQSVARSTIRDLSVELTVPLALHLTNHLSLALGLYATQTLLSRIDDVDSTISSTQYGLRAGFIGWF